MKIDLPQLLRALSHPECFPGNPKSVEIIQTHISIVCLVDDLVYKLKKPVRFSFLDFSTLEKRRYYCKEEVRLNRRLCPEVYRDVMALYQDTEGAISFKKSKDAIIIDYAVLMSRLPDALLMNHLLEDDSVTEEQIKTLATIVSNFHGQSESDERIRNFGSPENQIHSIRENFSQNYRPGTFSPELFQVVRDIVESRLGALGRWLRERGELGRIVEGHGDLHTGNIFLTEPPTIFDGIEFSPEFRCGDVAVENALLMMDLIYSGHSRFARIYLDKYIEESGDEGQVEQMPMLQAYQAMMRAKVAALTADDNLVDQEERDRCCDSANRHLQLAAASLLSNQNIVIQVCGLPGAGKSYLCEELSHRFGWPHFSSDAIRKEIAGYQLTEKLPDHFYTPELSKQTYAELQHRCELAMGNQPVMADANFGTVKSRTQFSGIKNSNQFVIWIDCDEKVVMQRLLRRAEDTSFGSDAGVEVYQLLQQTFEPPDDSESLPVLRVDGGMETEIKIEHILSALLNLIK